MQQEKVVSILKKLKTVISNPKSELNYNTSFELLIAVILSAHTTDKSVNKATEKLFLIANTPEKFLSLGENGLKKQIKRLGLFNTKTKNIINTCKLLIDTYNGKIPDNRKQLETLPGVGHKTANVILNIVFGEPTIAVDTHIFRVCNRTKIATGNNPLQVERKLQHIVPKNLALDAHHLLLLHGRYVCTARKAKCNECTIRDLCEYEQKTHLTIAPR